MIRARYASPEWMPPRTFAWRDLSYEAIDADAVVVVGLFDWGICPEQPPLVVSYAGPLVPRDGELRIRLADESVSPQAPPPGPCAGGASDP